MKIENQHSEIDLKGLYNSDMTAYSNLFTVYYSGLCGFAERIIGDEYAEDIVGDIFMKLWDGKRNFESELHLKAFLYRSVKNGCLNFIKMADRAVGRNHFYYEETADYNDNYLLEVTQAEVIRELHLAINELPPQAGKIIKLTYLEGMSNQEVADNMGLSIQTIKNQKLRGLGILKKRLPANRYMLLILLSYIEILKDLHKN